VKKLKRNLSELFERGILFIKEIENTNRVLVIHHKDVDGLVSAAILLRVFEKIGLKVTEVTASSNEEIEDVIKKIKDFDKIIILDIDICYLKEQLVSLNKDILLIDHHPPRTDLNTEKIVYINPRLELPEIYQPVSYILYKFLSRLTNLKDIEWLAVLGTIGDYGFEDCIDLLENWLNIRNKEGLIKTVFWKNVKMMNGVITELGYDNALRVVKGMVSLEDFEKNEEIKEVYEKFNEKLKEVEQMFWRNTRTIEELDLIISEIETDYRALTSFLSSELGIKHPDKIIVLMRKKNGKYVINVRYQGEGIHLGEMMKKCTKDLNGGGGHPHAAGATILAKNKEIFEERLIEELRRISAKRS